MRALLEKDNPLLREKAELILAEEFKSDWLKMLVQEMIEIMKEKGAVGVAAPQIGISKQVIVFGTSYTRRRDPENHIPDTALINPTYIVLSEEKEADYEGCLNTGELMGEVPRALEIEYAGYDLDGNHLRKRATGLEARILQHEIDHLNGILFFDRVENKETFTTYAELQKGQ
jgi:peptide deformylase